MTRTFMKKMRNVRKTKVDIDGFYCWQIVPINLMKEDPRKSMANVE